jgi:drug/metabolite transporter (DMT)-like permease
MPPLGGILLVVAAMAIWAFASVGYKFALGTEGTEKRDEITSMAIRILTITIFLGLLVLIIGNVTELFQLSLEQQYQYWGLAVITAIFTMASDFCQYKSLRYLDSSRVYPLVNTQILFTIPLAYLFLSESMPGLMWLAAILMIGGVMFVGNPDNKDRGVEKLEERHRKRNYIYGISFGIATGFFFGIQYVTLAMQIRIYSAPLEGNFFRILIYCIMLWAYLLTTRKHLPSRKTPEAREELRAYLIMGIIGFFSLGLGDTMYQMGVIQIGAIVAIIIASSAPLVNQFFAIVFLKEKFRIQFLIGVVCIVTGNILVIF